MIAYESLYGSLQNIFLFISFVTFKFFFSSLRARNLLDKSSSFLNTTSYDNFVIFIFCVIRRAKIALTFNNLGRIWRKKSEALCVSPNFVQIVFNIKKSPL